MLTRLQTGKLRRRKPVATSIPVEKKDKVPYLAKDVTNKNFLKHGCSSDVKRRVRDRGFGKAPRPIQKTIRDKANRIIDTVFIPSKSALYSGEHLERLFHKRYESLHVVGEWVEASTRTKIVEFYRRYGWIPKRVNIKST